MAADSLFSGSRRADAAAVDDTTAEFVLLVQLVVLMVIE